MGLKRPLAITFVALLNALGALAAFGWSVLLVLASRSSDGGDLPASRGILLFAALALAAVGVFYAAAAIGLWGLKNYGRVCQLVISALGLFVFPIGTILYGLMLYYLTRPGVRMLFSNGSATSLQSDERDLINRDAYGGVAITIAIILGLFGAIMAVGVVAGIALPGLVRGRVAANEASIVGAMRALNSAEAAWLAANKGQYTEPPCLGDPGNCGDAQATGPYLQPEIAALTPYRGYSFGFVLRRASTPARTEDPSEGVNVPIPNVETMSQLEIEQEVGRRKQEAAARRAAAESTAKAGYVYWAAPEQPGTTGTRRFCTDETGVVLTYPHDVEWEDPSPTRPSCPDGGEAVR